MSHVGDDPVCWRSKFGDNVLEGQRGLEIFARDLILAMVDHRETANQGPVHVKNDSFWRCQCSTVVVLVQMALLLVEERKILNVDTSIDSQQECGYLVGSPKSGLVYRYQLNQFRVQKICTTLISDPHGHHPI
jgi:hypothetical protein